MTLSAGVASYPHPAVTSAETLVRLADDALYAAKAGGRDRVVRFDELGVEPGDTPGPHVRARPGGAGGTGLTEPTPRTSDAAET
jgi:hypothetical protein